ncbi:MAG: hypothetical protein K8S15_00310 [Candidatus Aegiribacteria sp.]|nr:hypothetical protein [Candidatus Aegiribacteria sp.]
MISLEEIRKAGLLFHTGLMLFSIAPALIVFLIMLAAGVGLPISLVAGLLTIVVFQVNGLLFEKRLTDNPIPLKLSF